MRFRFNSTTLDQIIGGTLTAGLVPWVRSARSAQSFQNAGIVTVTAAVTPIVTLVSANVLVNDLILVGGQIVGTKGATAGDTTLIVRKNGGTAGILWGNSAADWRDTSPATAIGATVTKALFAIGYVSSGGTFTCELAGASAGSDLTIAATAGQMYMLILSGS
jgi:hypothetical protein